MIEYLKILEQPKSLPLKYDHLVRIRKRVRLRIFDITELPNTTRQSWV